MRNSDTNLDFFFQRIMGEKSIERALEVKLQGNELFKKNDFEAAISQYTEAIALCPPGKTSDLSIMYQNRAAALERLDRLEEGLKDCGESLRLNNRYGKSYDRRSKILKKLVDTMDGDKLEERIRHLRQALEDVSVLAQLDGYNPQQLVIVDEVLKQLGERVSCDIIRTVGDYHVIVYRELPCNSHGQDEAASDAFQLHHPPILCILHRGSFV